MVPPSTVKPAFMLIRRMVVKRLEPTFLELRDKTLGNLLELWCVDGKELLETLDLLEKVPWHIGHGSCSPALSDDIQFEDCQTLTLAGRGLSSDHGV